MQILPTNPSAASNAIVLVGAHQVFAVIATADTNPSWIFLYDDQTLLTPGLHMRAGQTREFTFDGGYRSVTNLRYVVSSSATVPTVGAATALVRAEVGDAPGIGTLTPATGGIEGGTAVTIAGVNLGDAKTVEFDGIPATNLNVVSATQITCKSPARRAGSVNVTVRTNADLVGTAPAAFTYASAFSLTRLNLAGYWRAADCTPVVTTSPVGLWWPGVPTLGPSIGRTTRILPPGGTGMVVGDLTASGKPSRRSTAAGFAQLTTSFASLFPTTSFTLFIVAKVRSAPNASATAANNACLLAGGGQYVFLRSNGQFGASLTGGQTAEATAAFSANTFAVYVVRFDGSRATAQLAVRVGNGAWSTANVTAPLVLSAPAAPPSPPVPVSLGYNPVANLYADADFAAVVVAGYAMSDADVTSSVNELVATYL